MSDDFYDEFKSRGGDGEQHPAWSWRENGVDKPAGTVFVGTITERFSYTEKKSGNKRMAFVCQTARGTEVLFVSQWRLEREIAQLAPGVGATLKIRYDGIDAEDGQSKTFTVKVDAAPEPQPDREYEPGEVF